MYQVMQSSTILSEHSQEIDAEVQKTRFEALGLSGLSIVEV